ncbi:uncharacterized protein [Rutidosis leptorrhynchoides]|uniref:uncharacterized protein n=1 Tax=Rutidosis leptorrhynchoides TaxID=125765 RepID=UPI003A99DCF8
MVGATKNPVQLNRSLNTSTGELRSPSYVNFLNISTTVDRLRGHLHGDNRNDDFYNLCIYLSRGIDYAVANNEIPDRASDLPELIKQVCQWAKDDIELRAGIMVLMISIKGACTNGWFSEKDNDELHTLRNKISTSFSSVSDMNSEESTLLNSISTVMLRFYPGMKMDKILAFFEAMPGFNATVKDFFIPNNGKSPGDNIYLFVAQTDNIETSSCIISPQHANFFLNGKAVDRTCSYKDPEPQIPTLVTEMVKYGTNILQVMGQYTGKCVIVIAYMSIVSNPIFPALPDYVPPPHSDNDTLEGPSKISLNCPISSGRIKTPVKGYLCKHYQCFDFDNYVDINSKKPLWGCPHCSQSVCFTDLRIDQTVVKILEEVGVNAVHVKISADGSWETVNEGDVFTDKQQDSPTLHCEFTTTLEPGADSMVPKERGNIDPNEGCNMDPNEGCNMDPKEGGDMDASNCHLEIDQKPSLAQLQMLNFEKVVSQGQSQLNSGNSLHIPTQAIGSSNTIPNVTMMAPVTDTFVDANSVIQTQTCASNDMHSQQLNSNNSSNGFGLRYPKPSVQQFTPFQMDQQQIMHMIAAPSSLNMGPQGWVQQDRSHVPSQPFQQFGPPKKLNVYRPATPHPLDNFNTRQHQSLNQVIPDSVPSAAQFYPQFRQGNLGPTNGLTIKQEPHHYNSAAAQQPIQNMSWTPPVPAQLQTFGSSIPLASSGQQRGQAQRPLEVSCNSPVVDPWHPTIPMQEAFSGQAYSDAMNEFIFHAIQPVQDTKPPLLKTPKPEISPHLQVQMDFNTNGPTYEFNISGSVIDGGSGGSGAGVLPYI